MQTEQLLFKQRTCAMLITLNNAHETPFHVSGIARNVGLTYVYATRVLHELEAEGIVSFEHSKKNKYVKLTPTGAEVAQALEEVFSKLRKKREACLATAQTQKEQTVQDKKEERKEQEKK